MEGYDDYAKTYDTGIARGAPVIERAYQLVLEQVGDVAGKRICDLGCGQGALSGRAARLGATVTGIDTSSEMLALAQRYEGSESIQWLQDDAQNLRVLAPETVDIAVANLMLTDVQDFRGVFASAWRTLVPHGWMIWTITHPCFQSPYSVPLDDGSGVLRHRRISDYAPRWWKSVRPGTVRGTVGSHHRPISDYINAFLDAGFRLCYIEEPVIAPEVPLEADQVCHYTLPPLLGVMGRKDKSGISVRPAPLAV